MDTIDVTDVEFALEGSDDYLGCPGCNVIFDDDNKGLQLDMWLDGDVIIQEIQCQNCGRKIRNFFDFQCRAQEIVK